jgi:hypothetical protein
MKSDDLDEDASREGIVRFLATDYIERWNAEFDRMANAQKRVNRLIGKDYRAAPDREPYAIIGNAVDPEDNPYIGSTK